MIETELGNLRRSHYSDEINSSMDGTQVTIMGWVLTIRGHGNITFATIRDKNGDISVVAKKGDCPDDIREKISSLKAQSLLRGADHFVIYDNDSCDDPGGVLAPWIARGIVELIPWPSFLAGANAQHMCYGHACRYMSGKTRWLSFLDLDEFLFPLEDRLLPEILTDYDDLSGIAVFMRCFGPGGHDRKPDGLVIGNYLKRLNDTHWENRQYKSIVKPERVHAVFSAQRCEFIDQKCSAYDENRRALTTSTNYSHTSGRLRINHYATRSVEEFERKLNRRYFWSAKNDDARRKQKSVQHQHLFDCPIEDCDILRFLPELLTILGRVDKAEIPQLASRR